jgi:hypothetical protein
MTVPLRGQRGTAPSTNLVGQTISAFMNTGSQGGSAAGNLFSIGITDGQNPTIVGTADASTTGGAQTTGWRLVSAVVPNPAVGRSVREVILSLELAEGQNTMSFSIDDVQLGD